MKMSDTKKKNSLSVIILIMFALGIVGGFIVPSVFPAIEFLGSIYVKLLKLLVVPLLMTQIAASVARTSASFAGRIVRVIILFVCMFVVSFLITAAIVAVTKPGAGVDLLGADWDGQLAATSVSGFFTSIISDNIISSMASASILPCILFAFVFGIAAAKVKAEKAIELCEDLSRAFSKMLEYVMYFTPIGVFALMGNCVVNYGAELLGVCAKYIILAWVLSAVVTLLVMILPVWIFAHVSPIEYIKKVSKIWVITLSTCSSAATLPNTIKVCNEDFGIPDDITGIVVPLGCTIHMCGGAVSFCLLGLFTMQMAGISVSLGTFIYMLVLATLINMAAPGIPGGGIVIGATYLTILGAPTGFIGMYSGIYRLLDMPYTTLNVTGDITANILISEFEKRKWMHRQEKNK